MLQTPAEVALIEVLKKFLLDRGENQPARLLNIGAGQSLAIENYLAAAKLNFICDRLDLYAPAADRRQYAEKVWQASIEHCPDVPTAYYDLAFANYVLEHVQNLQGAAQEIYRLLKPEGVFVLTTPNPSAPEFRLAHHTPLWLHQLIRGQEHEAFTTFYAYQSINELEQTFRAAGFTVTQELFFPFTLGYLHRFPLISQAARLYDLVVRRTGWKRLMGNVNIVFKKTN
jgi:SAM-dependent methyltransferase